ncbi:MAG TPA: hypothetical protein PKC43_07200 [Phycisphaerales bacterium]|nr:hypothetical protein [Phycisphaerales bacterium]HMP37221.1 hypothetical protein [Phycisphaerales bacterium]
MAASALASMSAADARGADLASPGPFLAGVRQVSIPRPNGTSFNATVHYPALGGGVDAPFDPAAAPAEGITFGHGFLQPVTQYASTMAHLATHGFIVVASQSEGGFFPNHANFALDLRFSLDWLEAQDAATGSFLEGVVETDRFGAFGHSMGGGAAILAARDDPRIAALAPLAAANTSPSSIAAMPDVRAAVRLIDGSLDTIVPPATAGLQMYAGAEAPKQHCMIVGGFHCGFTDDTFLFCDSGSITRAEQLESVRRLLTEFFALHLRGEQAPWRSVWGPETPPAAQILLQRDPGIILSIDPDLLEGTSGSQLFATATIVNDGPLPSSFTMLADPAGAGGWNVAFVPQATPPLLPGAFATIQLVATGGAGVEPAELLVTARRDLDGATRAFAPLALDAHPPTPDLDGNGILDGADLGILLAAWGEGPSPADLNEDGVVDGADLGILLGAWK